MKENYFEKLTELFIENNFDENTRIQITDKYSNWYDKLLLEGKSDEEIQKLLKSPEEVVEVFLEKFKNTPVEETLVQETVVQESVVEEIQEVFEEPQTFNKEENTQRVDPNLVTKTKSNGKTLYYHKRSFGGGFGVFLGLFIVSAFLVPLLFGLFSASLSLSFFSLLVFFTPVYYLVFIFNFDAVALIEPVSSGIVHNGADRVLTLPYEYINRLIDQLNQITAFDWPVFAQALLVSLFAFALLLVCLFITFHLFKLNVNYFAYCYNKITLKRIKI